MRKFIFLSGVILLFANWVRFSEISRHDLQASISPVEENQYWQLAKSTDYDFDLLTEAIIWRESRGRALAIGNDGERGLMQIMKGTWFDRVWQHRLGYTWEDAFDPEKNVEVGGLQLEWIRWYIEKYKYEPTLERVLIGYNAGVGALRRGGWEIDGAPNSTKRYVKAVINYMIENSNDK